jgi:D-amino-acid dehydrogenase
MSKRVTIVGAGVIGLTTAWYCRQKGWDVTIVDREAEDRNGCSYGNAGMVVPSHFVPLAAPGMIQLGLKWMWNPESPFYIKPRFSWDLLRWLWEFRANCNARHVRRSAPLLRDLHLRSRSLYEKLDEQLPGGIGLCRKGLLMLCRTSHGLDEEARGAELARSLQVTAEVLDSAAVQRLEPAMEMAIAGGVFYPLDCHLSPGQLMANLTRELQNQGVQMQWARRVDGWRTSGKKVDAIVTDQGEMPVDELVLCAGAWSAEVVRDLGLRLPMQAGKGYSLTLANPRQLPKLCGILTEARVAMTPIGQQLRFGGTMEIAGLNEEIGPRRIRGIVKSVVKYFPKFQETDFEGIQPWVGLRPCAPDGLPYLGRALSWENVTINSGHAMMGISLAPISAQLAVEIIAGEPATVGSLSLLAPHRFAVHSTR